MLGSPARAKTSVSGILSCHFIPSSFLGLYSHAFDCQVLFRFISLPAIAVKRSIAS